MALPARSPLPANLKLGRGRIFFANLAAGNPAVAQQGFADFGNCESFTFGLKDTKENMFESMDGSGLLYDRALVRREGELTVKHTEFSQENLALALMGTESPFTQTASTITAETLTTSLVLGAVYFTANPNITLTDVKIGATTLIAGVAGVGDYQLVDARTGCILINQVPSATNAATVIAGATVTTDYSRVVVAAATPMGQINIGAQSIIESQVVFVPFNVRGVQQMVTVFRVQWDPATQIDYIGDKYAVGELKGYVLSDQAGLYGGSPASPWGFSRNVIAGA